MKLLLLFLLLLALPALFVGQTKERSTGIGSSFKGPVGLQLYSLRDQFKKDVPGTLDQVKAFGIKYVETAGTYGVPPEKFRAMLDERGLKAVSGTPYEKRVVTMLRASQPNQDVRCGVCRVRMDLAQGSVRRKDMSRSCCCL
jgi:hypothetical protein